MQEEKGIFSEEKKQQHVIESIQKLDINIPCGYFLTKEGNYQEDYDESAIFATLHSEELIKNLTVCIRRDQKPKEITLCVKAGFQNNKKGGGVRHIFYRKHLEQMQPQSNYPIAQPSKFLANCALDFLSNLDRCIKDNSVAISYDKERKVFLFVFHAEEKYPSAECVLFVFSFDNDVKRNDLRLVLVTFYPVQNHVFKLIMSGNEFYQPLITPPKLEWRVKSSTTPVSSYQKLTDTLNIPVVKDLPDTTPQLEPEKQLEEDEASSYLMLFINGFLSSVSAALIQHREEKELEDLLTEEIEEIKPFAAALLDLNEKCSALYREILENSTSKRFFAVKDPFTIDAMKEYADHLTVMKKFQNCKVLFVQGINQYQSAEKENRAARIMELFQKLPSEQHINSMEKLMDKYGTELMEDMDNSKKIRKMLDQLITPEVFKIEVGFVKIANLYLKWLREPDNFAKLKLEYAKTLKFPGHMQLVLTIIKNIFIFEARCNAVQGGKEQMDYFKSMTQKIAAASQPMQFLFKNAEKDQGADESTQISSLGFSSMAIT